jgi:hypothetical protein
MFKPGLFRHFKGALYVAEGTVLDVTGTENKELVLYWSLAKGPSMKFVRDREEFEEVIRWGDGTKRPRFLREDME